MAPPRIHSFRGSWPSGRSGRATSTCADTNGEFSGGLLRTTFSSNATLPKGATDTGFRRDGRQLWIGADEEAAYLVSLEDPNDVDRWPAAKERIGCA